MRYRGTFIRIFLVAAFLLNNTRITMVSAANLAAFSSYGGELMNMDPSYWDLTTINLADSTLTATDSNGSASFVVDVSSIASAIDRGNLEIAFSANASIANEPGELDLASITIGFGAASTTPDSTVVLDRGTDSPGMALPLSSSAAIPTGTRYLFIQPANSMVGSTSLTVFSSFTLQINDADKPILEYSASTTAWTNANVSITLTAADLKSGVEGIYNASESQVSATSTYSFDATDNGSWTFTAKDIAGNVSDVLTVNVTNIDRTAPAAPTLTPDTTAWSKAAVGFTLSEVTAGSGEAPVSRQFRVNGGEWQTYVEPASVNLEGEVTLDGRTLDEAGNASDPVSATLKMDFSVPTISLSGDSHAQPAGGATITATIADSVSGVAQTKYTSGSQTVEYFASAGTEFIGSTFDVVSGGIYTVYAVDNAGNAAVSEITVNTYPTLGSVTDQTLTEDSSANVTFAVGDNETIAGDLVVAASAADSVLLPSLSPVNTAGSVSLDLIPAANQSGSTVVTVTVTDGGSLVTSVNFNVTVSAVNDAPVAQNDTVVTSEDTPIDFDVLTNDTDVDSGDAKIITSVDGVTTGEVQIINSGTQLRFIPAADWHESTSFSYTMQDSAGLTSSATVNVSANPVNDAPVITAVEDQTIDEDGNTGALSFTVSDVDGDSVTVTATSDNAGLAPDGRISLASSAGGENSITVTPLANATGTATITITANDGLTSSTETFVLTVTAVNDAPVAVDDTGITTDEDASIEISVLANDSDAESETLTVTAASDPANGSVEITSLNTKVTYTPDANFSGTDSFTYTVADTNGNFNTATVSLTVSSLPDAPIANDDTVATDEDTPITVYSLVNDSDPDNDSFKITSVTGVANGTIAELPLDGQSFTYTPNLNSIQSETLTYTITDATDRTATATVTINITPVNDAPVAQNDTTSTDEDTAVVISVLTNDSDVDAGDTLTITAYDGLTTGSVEIINSNTQLRFTPAANWHDSTTFTYAIRDAAGLTSSASVTVSASSINDAPVITTIEDQTIAEDGATTELAFSATDVDGDVLTVTTASDNAVLVPESGISLESASGGSNSITVTPAANANGTATITLTADDGFTTTTESFLLTVTAANDAPLAVDDTGITTNEDTAVEISVLTNDSDIESEDLTVTAVGTATHGTLTITSLNKKVTYTPASNYNGSDAFTYTVTDASGASSTANVSLTVTSVNDAPSAKADSATLNEDVVTTINVLANDTDVDLTTNPAYETQTLVSVGSPSHGTATVVSNQAQYTPAANYFGSDSFTYTMRDTDGVESSATVTLTVNTVNDYPTFANLNGSYTVNEDESLTFHFDISDVETTTESLMLQVVSQNQTKVSDSDLTLGGLGDASTDTTLTITPNANENQSVTIKLTLGDGFVTTVQSFTLNITPVNDAPVAVADSYSFTEDNSIVIDMDDLVGNDTDIDNDTLTYVEVVADSLTAGTLTVLDADAHTFTFTPPANFDDSVTFQYVMTDGTVQRTGTVTLSASAINDAPTLTLDAGNPTNFDEDTSAVLNFTIADYETAISLLAVQAGSSNSDIIPPDHIVITRNGDGTCTMTLTPSADQNGAVTITLSVSDGVILVEKEINLTVNPIQDAPVAAADSITVETAGSITFSPMDNDYDVDGDTIAIQSYDDSSTTGTVVDNSNGTFTYTAASGMTGSDSFTYTINDGNAHTATATVTVTVTGDNNPPEITGIANQFINEDNATGSLAFSVSDPDTGSGLTVSKASDNTTLIPADNIVIASTGTNQYTVMVTPVANKSGTAVITLTVTDEDLATDSMSFTVTVYPINDAPDAVADGVTTSEDTSVVFSAASLLSNDIDVDEGATLQITKVTDPAHGRLSYSASTKNYTYIPDGNYNGSDSFVYTMTDGETTDTATVTITITAVNDTPVAYSNWVTVAATLGQSINLDVRTNDYDIETADANLMVTILTSPAYGTAVVETNGTVTYTRSASTNAADWSDSFTYNVQDDNDPAATSNTATVYIDDYWGPSIYGNDQSVGMNEDTSTAITLSIADGYGSGYTVSFPEPTLGSITDADPTDQYITYVPDEDVYGSETIVYTVTSNYTGNPTDTVNLYITIYPINDAPEITPTLSATTIDEDTSTSTLHVDISDAETTDATDLVFTISSSNSDLVLDSGIAVTRAAGSIDFVITPIANRFGSSTITLLASDGVEQTTQSFTLTVNPVNDVPVADNMSVSTNEDNPLTITVISPNADLDGDTLTLTTPVSPSNGSLTINGDKTITYKPNLNFNGTDSFTYQLADAAASDTGVVTVTVNPVNDPPSITNLVYDHTTLEDTPKTVTFKVTDVDNSLSSSNVTITRGNTTLLPDGSVVISGTGEDISVVLTPAANLSGSSIQTVTVTDGTYSATQNFNLTVAAVNDIPVANADTASTNEDNSVTFNVVTNDTDVEAGTLTVVSFTNPAHGTIVNNRDGTLTYSPSSNWNGTDSFTYTIADSNNGQATATVTMTVNPVNDAPNAVTDSATIVEDNAVTLNLLTNDSDVEGSTLTLTDVSAPSKGTFVNNGGGSITYTPNADQNGLDSFTYTVSDGELTSTGTVNIQITAINDAPRLSSSVERPWTLYEDTPTSFPITIVDPETPSDNLVIKISSSVQSLVADTSITLTGTGQNKYIQLTPSLNQFGTLNLTIDASDGVNTTTEIYQVDVISVNDLPTITAISDKTVSEDTPTSSISFTVSDVETAGASLTVTAATGDGTLIPAANVVVTNGSGGSRSVVVTPAANQVGSTSVTLTVHDADNGTADEPFTLTVNAVNDAPTAVADTKSVNEDASVVIDVLANDTDADLLEEGDTLTLVSTSGVDNATAEFDVDKKTITFTPAANWNGTETFTYTMKDAAGVTSSASVTVTVNPVNDAPAAVDDSTTTTEDNAVAVNVLTNDTDIDLSREGDNLTIVSATDPANGTAEIATGLKSMTYTPDANWVGTDTFEYTITDQNGATSTAEVSVVVTAVNDPPTISDIADQSLTEDIASAAISFTVGDIDTAAGDLIVTAATTNGTVIPLGNVTFGGSGTDRTVTITPAANKNTWNSGTSSHDPVTLTVTVSDGFLSSSDTFTVTVDLVNDAPVAVDDTATTSEDVNAVINVLTNDSDVDTANEGDSIIVYSTAGVDNGTVEIAGDGKSLTFKPAANFYGSETFSYTIHDSQAASATASVTVTVNAVNDDPVISDVSNQTIDEDSTTGALSFTISDVDNSISCSNVTKSSNNTTKIPNANVVIGGSGTDCTVTVTPLANKNTYGTSAVTITLIISDGTLSKTDTFTVTITKVNDAPVAAADSGSVNEDNSLSLSVLANDTDIDTSNEGDTLTIYSTANVDNGTVSIATDKLSLTFTPTANWSGTETFDYTIRDLVNVESTSTVTVTVNAVNDAPTISDIPNQEITEDVSTGVISFSVDDIDNDLASLTVTAATGNGTIVPLSGIALGGTDGTRTIDVTPAADHNTYKDGPVTITVTVKDAGNLTASDTFTLTVTKVNDAPAAQNDSYTINEDAVTEFLVLDNDLDADLDLEGDTLSILSTAGVENGSVELAGDKESLIFTPAANWHGVETFTYTMQDAAGVTSTASVSVTVNAVNDAPVAGDDSSEVNEDGSVVISVLDNDTDIDTGDTLTIVSAADPAHGTVSIATDKLTLTYAPDADWTGTETFTYTMQDAAGAQSTATVTVEVNPLNDAPDAQDDTLSSEEDQSVSLNVLTNDLDVDLTTAEGDNLIILSVSGAAHGSAVVDPDDFKSINYTPDGDWHGVETLTYVMEDKEGSSSSATVTLTVTPVNDAPHAVADSASTSEDTPVEISVLTNDTDVDLVDGDILTIVSASGVDHGTVTVAEDKKTLTFAPAANWSGSEEFTYLMRDTANSTASATVTVTVSPANDAPIGVDDTSTTDEDQGVLVNLTGNDTDVDLTYGDTLKIASVGVPPHGTAIVSSDKTSVQYTPNLNWYGSEVFSYTVEDASGATGTATVTIVVAAVNDAPTAAFDATSTNEDVDLVVDVLANDSDVDAGDDLTIDSVSGVDNATVTIATDKKSLTFDPAADWNGTETFTYTIKDSGGLTASANVAVVVGAVNDTPQAVDDTASVNEDASVTINVLNNDTDVDVATNADSLSIKSYADLDNGDVSYSTDHKSLIFTPDANWNGTEIFSYTVVDSHDAEDTATVTITVVPQADSSVAYADSASCAEDGSVSISVLDNDVDIDHIPSEKSLIVDSVADYLHGTVAIASDKLSVTYTPDPDWNGTETFSYTIRDSSANTSSALVTVTVSPSNDPPQAMDDSVTTDEDVVLVIDVLENDEDADLLVDEGDNLLITGTSGTISGTLSVAADKKSITYTPPSNWSGEETFNYSIKDKNDSTSSAKATVLIEAVDDPPAITAIADQTIAEDSSTAELSFTISDIDSDLGDLTLTAVTGNSAIVPLDGIVLGGSGADRMVKVTPAANMNTSGKSAVTITLKASDGEVIGSKSFALTITPVNDAPVAVADSASMQEDTTLTISPLTNDTDVDLANEGDTLTISGTSGVNNATAQIINSGTAILFTPDANWNGTEEFTYTVKDSAGAQSSATIIVKVSDVAETVTPTPTVIPTFKVTSPAGGERYKDGNAVNVSWTALAASGVTYKVEFFDGSSWSTLASGIAGTSYTHLLANTRLHTRSAYYRVVATYATSKSASALSGTITIDNVAPQDIKVSLTPGDDPVYEDGVLTSSSVEITAEDGWDLTGISIRLLDDNEVIVNGGTSASAMIDAPGTHHLQVVATDPLGNTAVVGEYVVNILGDTFSGFVYTPEPEATSTEEPEDGVTLEFPEDTDYSYETVLVLPDGTEVEIGDDFTWNATEDGEYTFVSSDPQGNKRIMVIIVTGGKITSIEDRKDSIEEPIDLNPVPGAESGAAKATVLHNNSITLPVSLSVLFLLLLLLWPNVKIIYFHLQADGRYRKRTVWRWMVAPENDALKVKVKDADGYEIVLSRWLTRSVRGGSLTIQPQSFTRAGASCEIPEDARNRFRSKF